MHKLYTLLCQKKRDIVKIMETLYCSYYQAYVERELCWFVTASLRSYEHVAFDRTLDPATSLFEFFVPSTTEKYFLTIMAYFESVGLVFDLKKLPNRLENSAEQV
jgi:hypothetical protein